MEAAAMELEGFKGFKRLKPGKRQAWNALTREGYVQANTAKADGQRAWWKLPRGNWRVLSVLRVLREQERAMCRQMQQRLTARGLGGSCREGIGGF